MKPNEILNEEALNEGKVMDLLRALRIYIMGMNNEEKNFNIVADGAESGEIQNIIDTALKMEKFFYVKQRQWLRQEILSIKRNLAMMQEASDFEEKIARAENVTIGLNSLRKLFASLKKDPKKNIMKKVPKFEGVNEKCPKCNTNTSTGSNGECKLCGTKKISEASSESPFEAHGVYGMQRKQWTKKFRNSAEMEKWCEKMDAECHGTRDLESAKQGKLSPGTPAFEQRILDLNTIYMEAVAKGDKELLKAVTVKLTEAGMFDKARRFVRSNVLGNARTAIQLAKHKDLAQSHKDIEDAHGEPNTWSGRHDRAANRTMKAYTKAQLKDDVTEDASGGASCAGAIASGPAGNLFAQPQKRAKKKKSNIGEGINIAEWASQEDKAKFAKDYEDFIANGGKPKAAPDVKYKEPAPGTTLGSTRVAGRGEAARGSGASGRPGLKSKTGKAAYNPIARPKIASEAQLNELKPKIIPRTLAGGKLNPNHPMNAEPIAKEKEAIYQRKEQQRQNRAALAASGYKRPPTQAAKEKAKEKKRDQLRAKFNKVRAKLGRDTPQTPLEKKAQDAMWQVWNAIAPDAIAAMKYPGYTVEDEMQLEDPFYIAEVCTDANVMQTFAKLTPDEEREILDTLDSITLARLASNFGI